jgi:hypothetical protein
VLAEFIALALVRNVPREPTLRFSSRLLIHPRVEIVGWIASFMKRRSTSSANAWTRAIPFATR